MASHAGGDFRTVLIEQIQSTPSIGAKGDPCGSVSPEDARGLGFGRAHWCTRRPVPEGNQDYEHQMRQRVGGTRSPRRCSGGERGVMRRHAKEAMLHHFHVASE
eukprot:scaffold3165_cov29-Tisochrysis_lutea.AAC.4